MSTLVHPVLTPSEFAATMERLGWRAPIELIHGEVVVIPPTGSDASLAQIEVAHGLRRWQDAGESGGRALTDVFVRIGDAFLSPSTRANDLGPKRSQYLAAGVRSSG